MKIRYGAHPNGDKWEDVFEISDEDWNELTPDEKEETLNDLAAGALAYSCESWAYPEEN